MAQKVRTVFFFCNIDDKKHWIPKSVVHEDSEVSSEGDTGTIVLQRWFAEKEGLV
jgi:hypothetical protein